MNKKDSMSLKIGDMVRITSNEGMRALHISNPVSEFPIGSAHKIVLLDERAHGLRFRIRSTITDSYWWMGCEFFEPHISDYAKELLKSIYKYPGDDNDDE